MKNQGTPTHEYTAHIVVAIFDAIGVAMMELTCAATVLSIAKAFMQ